MRRFKSGSVADRRVVVIEVEGPRMSVVEIMPDGEMKRTRTELGSAADAQAAGDRMARELLESGFREHGVPRAKVPARTSTTAAPGTRQPDGSSWGGDATSSADLPAMIVASGPKLATGKADTGSDVPESAMWRNDDGRSAVLPAIVIANEPTPVMKKADSGARLPESSAWRDNVATPNVLPPVVPAAQSKPVMKKTDVPGPRPEKPISRENAAPPAVLGAEGVAAGSKPPKPKDDVQAAAPPVNPTWLDDLEPGAAAAPSVLPRMTAPALAADVVAGEPRPAKNKKPGGKKKRKKGKKGDELDMRVLGGIGAFAALIVGVLGFVAYDAFLKPPTIVGSWSGSMIEHEISRKLTHTRYDLVLGADQRASMTLQQQDTATGTYTLKGDRLELNLRGEEGDVRKVEYKISLGRVTLDLKDPRTGELAVQLLRGREAPAVARKAAPSLAAPTGLGESDPAADAALVSVDFSPKDSAFRLRYPPGWEHETGSRPDNLYSWVRITKGSAKIEVHANVAGSLMSGSDSNREPQPEGSEMAPVHIAHEQAKKGIAEEFSGYNESKPAVFKGSKLGEGRISQFTASGGMFGSKIRGVRVTLLTNDRRVSIICQCPDKEFTGYRPTFLAVSHSLAR